MNIDKEQAENNRLVSIGSLTAWREIREMVLEMTAFDLRAPDDLRHAGAYIKDGLLTKINARIEKEEQG